VTATTISCDAVDKVYDTIRPHQSLGYLIPQEFLGCYLENKRKDVMCHKTLNEDTPLTKIGCGVYHSVSICISLSTG
jgi:hypothetical protein